MAERTDRNHTVLWSILTERYWSELVESAHISGIKCFDLPCLFWNPLLEISVEMDKI